MNKTLLSLLCFIYVCGNAIADNTTARISGPEGYEVYSMSKNGKYVLLYNGSAGALWDVYNNEITYLGDDNVTTYAECVSDSGVVVGMFAFENIDDETSGTTVTGGIYKDGEYLPLLDEDGNWISSIGYGISPDGKYVCGSIWINSYTVSPALWNSDGTMIHRLTVEDGQVQGQATAVNNNGVAGGWYYHENERGRSNRQACYWTADNELMPIAAYGGVSGLFRLNGMSENGQYACASVGDTVSGGSKGVVFDLIAGEDAFDCSYSNIQVLNDATVMYNVEDEETGINEAYMLTDGESIDMKDYIEQVYGSSLDEDLDEHIFTGFMSEDKNVFAATSYNTSGYAIYATCWISNVSEYADVRSLTAETLPAVSDKVLLRWTEPLVNYDNVEKYIVYTRADTQTEWEQVAEAEPDYNLCVAATPSAEASDTIYYKVVASYGDNVSSGAEAYVLLSDFEAGYAEGPSSVYGYVYNYNDVAVKWTSAATGASVNLGLHNKKLNTSFGANTGMTFQAGALYDEEILDCYRDNYQLTGVQFYFNTAVEALDLLIYENEDVIYEKSIDQDALVECSYNVVDLDTALTLPEDAYLMVVLRVTQSGYGAPIELDEGPAVEGGDMLSEDDGATWTTMRESSSGTYDYNFVISMMLTDGDNPNATGYQVYCDGEAVTTVDAAADTENYEYIDNGVETGSHTYTVAALWTDGSEGQSEMSVNVIDKDSTRCPAPVNVGAELSSDSTELTVTWEMPRQSEFTYSNWSYRGMGETIGRSSGWFQGIQYTAENMKPYVGGEISRVSFYPISDAEFAIHIYEDDEEVSYMEVGGYTLEQINIVTLDEPVTIKAGYEYVVAIEGFDVAEAFLGNDDGSASGYCVYSEDGETYYTDVYESYGNYMMGIFITLEGDNSGADITYNVNIDGEAVATGIEELTYTVDVSSMASSSVDINVGAVYPVGESVSDDVTVVLNDNATGITNVTADGCITFQNGTIAFAGGAEKVCIYSINGQTMLSESNVETIDTSSLTPGFYVLKIVNNGKTNAVKISIVR